MNVRFSIPMLVAAGLVVGANQAQAQQTNLQSFNDPNITVDMSVLNDGGYSAKPSGPMLASPSGFGRKLIIPGGAMPQSQLYLKPPSGKSLAPARVAKPKPVAKPAPKAVAKATPKAAPKMPAKAPAKAKIAAAPAKPPVAPVAKATPKSDKKKPTQLTAPAKKKPVELTRKSPPPMPPKSAQAKAEPKKQPPKVSIPVPAAKSVEQASVPAAGQALKVGRVLRVAFAGQGTKLTAAAKPELANLAKKLQGSSKLRLQLLAYAGGDNLSSSLARRLSLSRALAVRSYLIENGVRSTRIDVRALGNKTTEQPFNRVDLNIAER
ncbi:MAG: OmpA family protein [Rhodospirillaceae bacterium]|jgi:outer membrane protein OmpA-like peptidoglycan-associated protein|nr:OmpA family protein [Rhodospirillaceae bacterium]MBT5307818.1 OmpA family protein [Rhodospirillaceae bacterium]MBT6407558.1 OmpA family protein [Rhodospirillaceae bacterium]